MTWNFTDINEIFKIGPHYGYNIPKDVSLNYKVFMDTRDSTVKHLNSVYERNWTREGIDLIHGRAHFVEPKTIEIDLNDGGKARYTARHILLAVGGRPILPDIKGAEHGITSDSFFKIEELPQKFAVVGAGYIAVEMAGMMAAVGVETHMFIRGDTLLRKFDPMVQKTITERYEAMGVHIHRHYTGFKEVQLLRNGNGADKLLKLIAEDGELFEFNEVLWGVGRQADVEGLNLDIPGIELNESGHITVDEYQNTTADGIYALGDVTGQAELCPGKLYPYNRIA